MNEIVPPSVPTEPVASSPSPDRCRQILLDILTSPALTLGEREQAADFTEFGYSPLSDSYHEAVLAAARWAFQHGDLEITARPMLRVVK